MLKAELHTHIKDDPKDIHIKYNVYDLIRDAIRKKFDVIAVTMHDKFFDNKLATDFARKRGILLIPGIEKTIKGKHVLILNCDNEAENIEDFDSLREYKKKNKDCLIIAPHPFHKTSFCLGVEVLRYFDVFDAWEFSYFYMKYFNPNKTLLKYSKDLRVPLVGDSDVHDLKDLGRTYSLIDSDKDVYSVLNAIRNNDVKVATTMFTNKEIAGKSVFYIYQKAKKFSNPKIIFEEVMQFALNFK
ncbi:MAG: PHP domain-containing protein [Nanobdellota archaeon]